MAKRGKRYRRVSEKIDPEKTYTVEEACQLAVETRSAKFDESVEVAIRLGVDPRKADQNVRGTVALPHGLGKEVRVAVFAKGEKADEARQAGADFVGSEELIEEIKGGMLNFDTVVATPDMMVQVGKIGKILGPRGLMPSPKVGTVTFEVGDTVRSLKRGRADFRVEKAGIIHRAIGKASFTPDKLVENANALLQAVNKAKPSTSKGVYLRSAAMSLTMGPPIKLDLSPLRNT